MSLLNSIQLASSSLHAAQIGLQVSGNNIANANTPGYIRQEAIQEPAPSQRKGNLILGLGVSVAGIIQRVDNFLEDRLRSASSDLEQGETQEAAYLQLESLIGELSETDLSTSLTNFFSSVHDIANQPESVTVRNLAVLKGGALSGDIRSLASRVRGLQTDANARIENAANEINQLVEEIARLNTQIVTTEGGDITNSDAVGLRDRQLEALAKLERITGVRAVLQADGTTSVYAGSDVLVFAGSFNEVKVESVPGDGLSLEEVRSVKTDAPLGSSSGRLAGLYHSRDVILGGFLEGLDDLAKTLAFEFNKVHSSGQGLTGFTELTSLSAVGNVDDALDQVQLPYTPVNGGFQVKVLNEQTGLTETHNIEVRLHGLNDDTNPTRLVEQLDAIDGITASITSNRRIDIRRESTNVVFSFANDTSGVLGGSGSQHVLYRQRGQRHQRQRHPGGRPWQVCSQFVGHCQ